VPRAAKRDVLLLAPSGLAAASRLRSTSILTVQRGRVGSGVDRSLGYTRWDATAQGGRCTSGHCHGARMRATTPLKDVNHGDDTSWREGREFGGESPDRWAPAVSVGGAAMEGRLGSRVEMGRGCCSAGPTRRKIARDSFLPFLIPFPN
jgi:hypothetical protein